MGSGEEYLYMFAMFGGVLVVFGATMIIAWKRRPKELPPEPLAFNDWFYSSRWYRKLNLGAFVITPLWLFSNGMWLLAILYLIMGAMFPPLALAASVFLFFRGSILSWSGGERWGNNPEAFLDEQLFWSMVSWILLLAAMLLVFAKLAGRV